MFKYDERCPADLAERLDECRGSYLEDSQLTFHDDNDLIADGRRRDIRRACKYVQCGGGKRGWDIRRYSTAAVEEVGHPPRLQVRTAAAGRGSEALGGVGDALGRLRVGKSRDSVTQIKECMSQTQDVRLGLSAEVSHSCGWAFMRRLSKFG